MSCSVFPEAVVTVWMTTRPIQPTTEFKGWRPGSKPETLPLFNPDLEGGYIPALDRLKTSLEQASGLIIASPEYAHGISGPMKNALDWLVSGVEFPNKPIMIINTSPRASHALQALKEVLVTMSGIIVEKACVSVPLLGSGLDKEGILATGDISHAMTVALIAFCHQIKALQNG